LKATVANLQDDRRHLFDGLHVGRFLLIQSRLACGPSVGTRCFCPVAVPLATGIRTTGYVFEIRKPRPSVFLRSGLNTGTAIQDSDRGSANGGEFQGFIGTSFLGWGSDAANGIFYVRQLRDMKGQLSAEVLRFDEPGALNAGLCGWTRARAHPRSGNAAPLRVDPFWPKRCV